MRQKHLESALSTIVREFPDPDISLEQYPTSPQLAASVALTARDHGDVGIGRTVLDLGCGTGILAMAAALLESDIVLAVDCDPTALDIARENARILDLQQDMMEFILGKVKPTNKSEVNVSIGQRGRGKGQGRHGHRNKQGAGSGKPQFALTNIVPEACTSPVGDSDDGLQLRSKCVDTVLCNPPFGTKNNAGMDVRFLRTAVRLARRAVYSFHKTSTRSYLQRLVTTEWKLKFTVVAEMQFAIDHMYKFHKEKTRDVAVDLIRIDIAPTDDDSEAS